MKAMPVKIDIIILSYAKTDELKQTTLDCLETLAASESSGEVIFETLVIESNKQMTPYQYPGTKTIYPDTAFGYNKYMNIGIGLTNNQYVCLCNNDLVFHKNWAGEILKAMDHDPAMLSATPYCDIFHKKEGFAIDAPPAEGYFGALIGWCIFVKREIFNTIGLFDEKLLFWYCDYDYLNMLKKYGVKNCLVSTSHVTHLGSESLNTVSEKDYKKLTQEPRFYFNYKWHHHSYLKFLAQTWLFKIKMALGLD